MIESETIFLAYCLTFKFDNSMDSFQHENESTYLLDQPVNLVEISKFLYNFHQGSLTRFLRSSSLQTHTHLFDFKELTRTPLLRNTSVFQQKRCQMSSAEKKTETVMLQELTSSEFENAVIKSNKVRKKSLQIILQKIKRFFTDFRCVLLFCKLCFLLQHAVQRSIYD